jgi:peroxiredoxin
MARLETPDKDNNFKSVDFSLPGTDGRVYDRAACAGPRGLLVMVICNHCPYVKAVIDRLVGDCRALQESGIGCVAIMPNDTAAYPADSFDNMKLFARAHQFSFPYLLDESQEIARAYGAVCTPDLFGFNADGVLCYRGRVDSAGPNEAGPDTARELRNAMTLIAQTGEGPAQQVPSMGCSIKWRA